MWVVVWLIAAKPLSYTPTTQTPYTPRTVSSDTALEPSLYTTQPFINYNYIPITLFLTFYYPQMTTP